MQAVQFYVKMPSHNEIKSAFNEIYNDFYLKHRNTDSHNRSDDEWQNIMNDAKGLYNKYEGNLAKKIVFAILEEFEHE